ncbi:protocadherin-9-like isoform X2 [Haliotis cracherodii]|uniref:protocadherin-9-like isoform X2 n=1 Tax=Haliotis cracherodii TaxID=6455 RepID=UPI0039E86C12
MCLLSIVRRMLVVMVVVSSLVMIQGQEFNLMYQVLEEQPEGTFVANIANDLIRNLSFTAEELNNHKYSMFTKDVLITNKFSIDETTGIITTGMRLDRETECEMKKDCELSFDVGFYYRPPNKDTLAVGERIVRIAVKLEDINDNSPTFPERAITRNISESVSVGHIIAISPAIDKDMTGNNSVKTYKLFPSDGAFGLNIEEDLSGNQEIGIIVKEVLDRETKSSYRLTIFAKDGGSPRRSGSVDINIVVTDVNDNTPHFDIRTFTVLVKEDHPVGSTILTLTAMDEDIGKNSELSYSISPRATSKVSETFMIDSVSGELYPIKQLDYEQEKQYHFPVVVQDQGNPVRSTEASVIVNVTDVNDNAPQINPKQYLFNLSESAKPGSFFTVFSVVDSDRGDYGQVNCSITDPRFRSEYFQYNYWRIYLDKQLDYEQTKVIEVNITCRDSGTPPKKNITSIVVQVQDVNDNIPVFPNSTMFAHISENNNVGDHITTLKAIDIDGPGNNNMRYDIVGSSRFVTLDSVTGEMKAKKVFDCEIQSSFEVPVIVMDAKFPSMNSTASVVVTVQDENDMPPRFTKPLFKFNITENLPAYSVCGTLTAVDPDASNNFVFSFRDTEAVRNLFKLDSRTGDIRSAVKLTREDNIQYNFGVKVMDPDKASFRNTADVTVYVMEDLDKPPVITFPNRFNNSVSVPFNSKTGTLIGTIQAIDDGRDGQIILTFTIEQGNEKTLFRLNPLTGKLTLARAITSEDEGDHEMLVAVHDNGIPRHTTYSYFTVTIEHDTANASFDYLPIVISLSCLTVIIALTILLGILCMKKRDKKRREELKKQEQGVNIYTLPPGNDPDTPRYTSHSSLSRKKVFDEIERNSYKFRDDVMESSFQEEEDDKISDLSHIKDYSSHGSTFDPGRKYMKYRQNSFLGRVDDGASDVSMATDSGRGTSDEDINSNRALMLMHTDSVISNCSNCSLV